MRVANSSNKYLPSHHSELETFKLSPRMVQLGIRNCLRYPKSSTGPTMTSSPQLTTRVCAGLARNWGGQSCLPSKQLQVAARYRRLPDTHYPSRRQIFSLLCHPLFGKEPHRRTRRRLHYRASQCSNMTHIGRNEAVLRGWGILCARGVGYGNIPYAVYRAVSFISGAGNTRSRRLGED